MDAFGKCGSKKQSAVAPSVTTSVLVKDQCGYVATILYVPVGTSRADAGTSLHSAENWPLDLPTVTLGDYVEVTHGCGASPSPRKTGLEVLKISAATRGEFRPSEKKFAFDRPELRRRYDLCRGDVLLCRVNGTLGYVGMSALVEEDMPNLIFPDKLIRVRVKDGALMPDFLWRLLQLPNMRAQIESYARTAVGNYAIGSSDIADFQIPLPQIKTQRELVKELREARHKAARLRAQAWADFLGATFN
jgi:hypothetical protein